MPNLIDICNQALAQVGESKIETLEDQTQAGRLCKLYAKDVVRRVLESGTWRAARQSADCAKLSTNPPFGWASAFQLPVDFLRLVSFNDIDTDDLREELFEVQGSLILTDEGQAKIVYVRDLCYSADTVALMGPSLATACVYELAAILAPPFQRSASQVDMFKQLAAQARREAKAKDAQEQRRPITDSGLDSRWLGAHR